MLAACAAGTSIKDADPSSRTLEGYRHVDDLYVVDCLLPGEVRQMGQMTYLTPRRPIKTTAFDCRVRGGEYVAYDRADYRSALRVWEASAMEGDAEAQVMVGEIYEKGLGTPPDYAKAAEWYRKAADQGNQRGITNLAYLYEHGLGVRQDMVKAINLYRQAAGDGSDELMLASAAREKFERQRAELERELDEARAQKRALARQLDELKGRVDRQQAQRQEDRDTIDALEKLLADTNSRLDEKSERLEQLAAMAPPPGAKEDAEDTAGPAASVELERREAKLAERERELDRREEALASETAQAREAIEADRRALAAEEARIRRELDARRQELALRETRLREEIERQREALAAEASRTEADLEARREALAQREAELEQQMVRQREALVREENQTKTALDARRQALARREAALEEEIRKEQQALARRAAELEARERAAATSGSRAAPAARVPEMDFGRYYALVIGLQDYRYWDELSSARRDADRIADVLRDKYGFETKVLHDAGAMDILTALNELRVRSDQFDNVIIYFAGRGQLRQPVEDSLVGYWLPVDAQREMSTLWLPNSQINEQIAMLEARSVMVIADSCYAGAMSTDPASLLLGSGGELSERRIRLGLERRARYTLSSGGLHPVPDPREGKHSIFAGAMIEVLTLNDGVLSEQQLIQQLTTRVTQRAQEMGIEQRPELKPIRAAGHIPGGSFYLVPKELQAAVAPAPDHARYSNSGQEKAGAHRGP